ncbi:hypothetical protein LTR39_005933, partial [Cryomyces antarcticus]
MGGGLALLFAEKGLEVLLNDPSEETMDGILSQAKDGGIGDRISKYKDYKTLCKNLGSPKVFLF